MSSDKPSLAEILHKNRSLVLAVLGVPILGMALAFILILYKRPNNMLIALAVIFFIAVQYSVMMFFWTKRVEVLAQKSKQKKEILKSHMDEFYYEGVPQIDYSIILAPEEERIFPVGKKGKSR